jgi:hypothetical protein
MLVFFGGKCLRCDVDDPSLLVKDHIVPIYQGGDDSIRNLQPLCRKCNASKGPESIDFRVAKACDEMPAKWLLNAWPPSPSSLSSAIRKEPPNPPRRGGRKLTRKELEDAEAIYRRSWGGWCKHDPKCADWRGCVELIALAARERVSA